MSPGLSRIVIIIVTHNSEAVIHRCLACLFAQTLMPAQVLVLDSGSRDPTYLKRYENDQRIQLIFRKENIGFCRGNNIAYAEVFPDCDYVLFLNPDAFLTEKFLEESAQEMEDPSLQRCGALSGMLLGYDLQADKATNRYDSTAIFRRWYGKWYDRGQGEIISPKLYNKKEEVSALCGAALFCRKAALNDILLRSKEVFDETFYMYKDDIDLSLRLSRKGWKLFYCPYLIAYHCRGWLSNRAKVSRSLRLLSAKNELRIHWKEFSLPGLLYSLAKYFAVRCFDL